MVGGGGGCGGRPMETTEDHRGQFPRTDFGPVPGISGRTPKATLVWDQIANRNSNDPILAKRIFRIQVFVPIVVLYDKYDMSCITILSSTTLQRGGHTKRESADGERAATIQRETC